GLAGVCGKRADGTRYLYGPRIATGPLDPYPAADWSAWPGFDKFVYFVGMIPVQGARGCLYDCAFCSSSAMKNALRGGYYRTRSPERIVEEVGRNALRFRDRGARYAWFWDLNFLYDRPWLEGFREAWPKARLRLPISVFSRPDHVTEETADILRELGCFQVRMGIESGDERLRNDVYRKDLSDEQVHRAARLLHKRGIGVLGYFILGGPGETWRTLGKTLAMAAAIRTDRPAFFVFKPMAGTRASSLIGEMEIPLDPDRAGRNSDILSQALLDNPGLPARWVDRVQGAANAFFGVRILARQLLAQRGRWFARLAAYWRAARREGLTAKDALMTFFLFGYDNYRT
ncbi:MAG: radical SAM protein, partial [Candidatus Methylomirabilis sp.]|nr:radical SAM protein [Deltaproteobacteria bacterium]